SRQPLCEHRWVGGLCRGERVTCDKRQAEVPSDRSPNGEKECVGLFEVFLLVPSEILKAQVIRRVVGKAFEVGAAREVIARISDKNPRRLGHYDLLCQGHQLETLDLVVGACCVSDKGVDLVVLIVAIVDE